MPKNPNNPNENGGNKEPISFIQSGLQYIHPASFFQAADKEIPRQRKEKHIKRVTATAVEEYTAQEWMDTEKKLQEGAEK